jgi:hypothetical protein
VRSCSSGTSHLAKQNARVRAGFDAAYNPFWKLLNRSEIGLAGHSYGAAGVSYIGQWDPRVKAIVAWDNLGTPTPGGRAGSRARELGCPGDPAARTDAPIAKPALGMSADYFLPPVPNFSLPDPLAKSTESLAYTRAGVDTGEIIIRGGSHLDFSFIPLVAFGASLYGADEISWYTTAWFDKYLKHDSSADRRLLTNRWRNDRQEAAIDPTHDPNMFSFYYPSRLDIHRSAGGLFDCEDMRAGCAGMVNNDGYRGQYSYIAVDKSTDG